MQKEKYIIKKRVNITYLFNSVVIKIEITALEMNISPPIVGVELFALWVSGAKSKIGCVALALAHFINFGITKIVIKNAKKKAKIALNVM